MEPLPPRINCRTSWAALPMTRQLPIRWACAISAQRPHRHPGVAHCGDPLGQALLWQRPGHRYPPPRPTHLDSEEPAITAQQRRWSTGVGMNGRSRPVFLTRFIDHSVRSSFNSREKRITNCVKRIRPEPATPRFRLEASLTKDSLRVDGPGVWLWRRTQIAIRRSGTTAAAGRWPVGRGGGEDLICAGRVEVG